MKEGRDPLGAGERGDEERVGAEGSLDPEPPVGLTEVVGHASDLLVLLQVPADRGARAHRLPVEPDLGVLHLDLALVQRPALARHAALTPPPPTWTEEIMTSESLYSM